MIKFSAFKIALKESNVKGKTKLKVSVMEKAYLVKVSGRVTGVGFRYSALLEAEKYPELKGYVRNVGYGQVEALLQGDMNEVGMMIGWFKRGPRFAKVDDIAVEEVAPDDKLQKFDIK